MNISNPNEPTFVFDGLPLHWQMTRPEKFAFAALLKQAQAEVALEVGTYLGGSLQMIAAHAGKVYSLDINQASQEALKNRFPNVEFLVGDSGVVLPELISKLQAESAPMGFVLIDGDHSAEGVRRDINAVLRFVPNRPVYLLLHDSFNPACREGILTAGWKECPYVHFVEVDFIPGVFHFEAFDTAPAKSMFGGFAFALIRPEPRSSELRVHQSQAGLFQTVLSHSCHVQTPLTALRGLAGKVKRRLLGGPGAASTASASAARR